ncbi:MAG: hypothetical protein V2A54_16615 [Bacteroidota bacterium]
MQKDSILVRSYDSADVQSILKDDFYDYSSKPKSTFSFWDVIREKLQEIFFSDIFPNLFQRTIWIIIGIVLLVFFLLKFRISIFKVFQRNRKIASYRLEENVNDDEPDYEKLFRTAEMEKVFPLAIRYRFLYILKLLDQYEILKFNSRKTNREYYLEISELPYKNSFRNASIIYDLVWYGEYALSESDYNQASSVLKECIQQIDRYEEKR